MSAPENCQNSTDVFPPLRSQDELDDDDIFSSLPGRLFPKILVKNWSRLWRVSRSGRIVSKDGA